MLIPYKNEIVVGAYRNMLDNDFFGKPDDDTSTANPVPRDVLTASEDESIIPIWGSMGRKNLPALIAVYTSSSSNVDPLCSVLNALKVGSDEETLTLAFSPYQSLTTEQQEDKEKEPTPSIYTVHYPEGKSLESTTSKTLDVSISQRNIEITKIINNLLYISEFEYYEVGFDNKFTELYRESIQKYGNEFLAEFMNNRGRFKDDDIEAAIDVIGRIKNSSTFNYRYSILITFLSSMKPIIRDVASSTLVELTGGDCVEVIQKAIDSEENESLKEDMELLIKDMVGV